VLLREVNMLHIELDYEVLDWVIFQEVCFDLVLVLGRSDCEEAFALAREEGSFEGYMLVQC